MKRIIKTVISLLLCFCMAVSVSGVCVMGYSNSMVFPDTPNGFGDPFILKYNGTYYLYGVSGSKVHCWSCRDMVNWQYFGDVMAESPSVAEYDNPFAAEVFYFEGSFYMYGSPMGKGHYVYKSDSPTGPFTVITEKLDDRYIDGTFFADNDGKLMFLCGGIGHISYALLSSPYTGFPEKYSEIPVSIANMWTEGPTLFKRNGEYYLTYTGNQVWEKNYRVEYAHTDNLNNNFIEETDNTILLNTEGDTNVALGHNSVVIGPDLDSYYIVYHDGHDFNGTSVARNFDMDRIVWNGKKLCVSGPSVNEMPNPDLPEFYDYFDGRYVSDKWVKNGEWSVYNNFALTNGQASLISNENTGSVFSVEYNLICNSGSAFCVFNYTDNKNYSRMYVSADNTFVTENIKDGIVFSKEEVVLPQHFKNEILHTFKVVQTKNSRYFYIDGTEYLTSAFSGEPAGKIGYIVNGSATVGFTAFSSKAMGSDDYNTVKPVPSKIEAVHANNIKSGFNIVAASSGALGNAVNVQKDQELKYNVNVQKNGAYSFDLSLKDVSADTGIGVSVDGKLIKYVKTRAISSGSYDECCIRGIDLTVGNHEIGLYFTGNAQLYELNIQNYDELAQITNAKSFTAYETLPLISENTVSYTDADCYGKAMLGNEKWGDYSADVSVNISNGDTAGLLVRATDCLDGYRTTNPQLDDKYYQKGYYIGFKQSGNGYKIVLEKHSISEYTLLAQTQTIYSKNTDYNLRVDVTGSNIKIYVNNTLVLQYNDGFAAYTVGNVGIRSANSVSVFKNLSVTPFNVLEYKSTENITEVYDYTKCIKISPDSFIGNGFGNKLISVKKASDKSFGKALNVLMEEDGDYKNSSNCFLNSLISAKITAKAGKYALKFSAMGLIPKDTYIFVKEYKNNSKISEKSMFFKKEMRADKLTEFIIEDIDVLEGNIEISFQFWADRANADCNMELSDFTLVPVSDNNAGKYYEQKTDIPVSLFYKSGNHKKIVGGVCDNEYIKVSGINSGIAISTSKLIVPNGKYTLRYYIKNTACQKSAKFMANVDGTEYYDQLKDVASSDWSIREITDIPVTSGKLTVMLWYSNTIPEAELCIGGISLLREFASGGEDVAEADFSNNYEYNKEFAVSLSDMIYINDNDVLSKSESELVLSQDFDTSGYFYKTLKDIGNGIYSLIADIEISGEGNNYAVMKANPGDTANYEAVSAYINMPFGYSRRICIDDINVENGKLFIRFDYILTAGSSINIKNIKLLRVGEPNYITVVYQGFVKANNKIIAPAGEKITVAAEPFVVVNSKNYRFVGWYSSKTKISEEYSINLTVKQNDSIIKKYYYMPEGTVLFDTNNDGKIDLLDLIRLKKHLVNSYIKIEKAAADIDGDGIIDSVDLSRLLKRLVIG